MSSAELALCCASHSGERVHTEKVASWLKRLGLDATNLECGPQMPSDQETAEKLIQSGKIPYLCTIIVPESTLVCSQLRYITNNLR